MCGRVTSDFDHRVLKQQPLHVLTSIGKDTLKLFALGRTSSTGDPSITRWQFQAHYPQYPPYIVISHGAFVFGTFNHNGIEEQIGTGSDFRGGNPAVTGPLASFLRGYQLDGGYTPGPLFAFTVYDTVPLPLPLAPAEICTNPELLFALQPQPDGAVTFTLPVPPPAPNEALVADSE